MTEFSCQKKTEIIAEALVGGLRRFPDPLASVFVIMDLLSLASGGRSLIRLDGPWTLVNDPAAQPKEWPNITTASLGNVRLEVACRADAIDNGCADFLGGLSEALEFTNRGAANELAKRFVAADKRWLHASGQVRSEMEIAVAPDHHEGFAKAVARLVEGYRSFGSAVGRARIAAVYTVTHTSAGGHRFCSLIETDEPALRAQQVVPECLLRSYTTGFAHWSERNSSKGGQWLAIPCTVANAAWTIVLCECGEPYWKSGLDYYRDTLPRLLEAIRMAARSAYVEQVLQVLELELKRSGWQPKRLNEAWQALGYEFPFATPQLVPLKDVPDKDFGRAITIGSERWMIQPRMNSRFQSLIKTDSKEPWGDIGDLAEYLQRAVRARLAGEARATGDLAQSVAHEYKNLTRNASILADRVNLDVNADIATGEAVRVGVGRLASQVKQLSRLSLALFELTKNEARFVTSEDSLDVVRAAMRIMLYIRSQIEVEGQSLDVTDDLGLEEAIACLSTVYGVGERSRRRRRKNLHERLDRLLSVMPVQFLMFAVHEPVNNMRSLGVDDNERSVIKAWTAVDRNAGECHLYQETVEPADTTRNLPSSGADRTNKILPADFCRVNTKIEAVKVEPVDENLDRGDRLVRVTRVTRIFVTGRPEARIGEGE